MDDKELRAHVTALLNGGNAHMTFDEAIKDFPESAMNTVFVNGTYTFWDLLEHIRRTQSDILEFVVGPYKEKEWPKDYWPPEGKKATKEDWKKTVDGYRKDLKALVEITNDPETDLYSRIKWGDGQTVLREMLLVADHSAYHIGEFAIMRQAMKNWGKSHTD